MSVRIAVYNEGLLPRIACLENLVRRRIGFTLIEVVAVIVVLSILSTITAVALGPTLDRQRLSQAIEKLEWFDAKARRSAQANRSTVSAKIDPSKNRLVIQTSNQQEDVSLRLPSNVEISKVQLAGKPSSTRSESIQVSPSGYSTSYAVLLKRGELSKWVLVLGGSGQVVQFDNAKDVNALLSIK